MNRNFLFAITIQLITGCSRNSEIATPQDRKLFLFSNDTLSFDSVSIPELIRPDTIIQPLALFISGLPQTCSSKFKPLEDSRHWLDFSQQLNQSWDTMNLNRLKPMNEWQATNLSPQINTSLALFYPFSGPDFVHAFTLYPDCREFILSGLEPTIDVPDLFSMNPDQQDDFLSMLNGSLKDVFAKSFFITRNMEADLGKASGVIPVLLHFMARTGNEVISMTPFTLDSIGRIYTPLEEKLVDAGSKGVMIEFRSTGGGFLKTLYYFPGDVSDQGLKKRLDFLNFLQRKKPFNTFIKSASYLMHQNGFSAIRDTILTSSSSIFQDDTGIPYRFFKRDAFHQSFFGEYEPPIQNFRYRFSQSDLDSAFKSINSPLSFSLGYHYGSRKQHYMLFINKNLIFVP